VHEPLAVAAVNPGYDLSVVIRATGSHQPHNPPPDMSGQTIYEKSAQELQDEFDEAVVEHGPTMMSLGAQFEKAGKA
jgi:hypothetical protein